MTHARVREEFVAGGRHEGHRKEGSLGGVRTNAGGDGYARHRQCRPLREVTAAISARSECDEAIRGAPVLRSLGGLLRCVRDALKMTPVWRH